MMKVEVVRRRPECDSENVTETTCKDCGFNENNR